MEELTPADGGGLRRRGIKAQRPAVPPWKAALLARCEGRVRAQRDELLRQLRGGGGAAEVLAALVDTEMRDGDGGGGGADAAPRARRSGDDDDGDLTADERIELLLYLERALYGVDGDGASGPGGGVDTPRRRGDDAPSAEEAAALYEALEAADARHLAAQIGEADALQPPLSSWDDAAAMLDDDGDCCAGGNDGAAPPQVIVALPRGVASLPLPTSAATDARLTDVPCPVCGVGRLAAIGPLLRCCRGGGSHAAGGAAAAPCGLELNTSAGFVGVEALRVRLAEVREAHASRGCTAVPAVGLQRRGAAAVLFATCASCGDVQLVA